MAGLFEAHVTNLGKYNEGVLAGEPLSFPASPQAVQALLKDIGVDGIRYEEIFIASYDFGGILPELSEHLGEYESLDELNHLACLLSEIHDGARGTVYKLGQILLRPAFFFPLTFDFPAQGVKIKIFFVLVHSYITPTSFYILGADIRTKHNFIFK